jgi:hypothetical protein
MRPPGVEVTLYSFIWEMSVNGPFNFRDKAVRVKMNGNITRAGKCVLDPNSGKPDHQSGAMVVGQFRKFIKCG